MNPRSPLLLALALLPLVALSQTPPAEAPVPASVPGKPLLSMSGTELRDMARDVARTRAESPDANASRDAQGADADPESSSRTTAVLGPLPMRARKVAVRYECLLHDCKAYDADGNVLYSVPRTTIAGADKLTEDQWLACQSGDDMLSTFERFDQCRGVGLLVPTPWDAVLFRVPLRGSD
jgi:hypothetical protein